MIALFPTVLAAKIEEFKETCQPEQASHGSVTVVPV